MNQGAVLSAVAACDPEIAKRRFDQQFSAQISTLRHCDCPRAITKALEKKRSQVITRAAGMTFLGSKRIFFSSIIPASQLSIPEQMLMVHNNDIPGCTFISPKDITDTVETPTREPYFIFGIDDGAKTLGWAPQQAERAFSKQPRRRGLSCVEAIGLCRISDILSRFNIDAIASRVKKTKIPFLWVVGKEPRLGADNINTSAPKWGVPSCNTIIV
ncbi:MAG: DUF5701 family protein [Patescibacteria group bacterium]